MREVITHINKGSDSPARVSPPERTPLRIAAIQEPWHGSVEKQKAEITAAVEALTKSEPAQVTAVDLWSAAILASLELTISHQVDVSPTSYLIVDVVGINIAKVAKPPKTY